jgi:hypothetical protein
MITIYRRTAKGDEEIKKRSYKLDHFHRFVLIMIDGKANTESIIARSSEQWNPVQCLFEMEAEGFIENIDNKATPAANISTLKHNLIAAIQKQIPKNNTKLINRILNAEMQRNQMTDAIDSNCIFIKLTISEKISDSLKIELHRILDESDQV